MMQQVTEISGFIATGAAWGLVWLGLVGILHKDVGIVRQAGLVGLAFALFGTIYALLQYYGLYEMYSSGSDAYQRGMRDRFTGSQWWAHWAKLAIAALPFFFWFKRFRTYHFFIAFAGICYVLLEYYNVIVSKFI